MLDSAVGRAEGEQSVTRKIGFGWALFAVWGLCAMGCSDDGAAADASGDTLQCADNSECDDQLFCNGTERCEPGASGAGADGCVPGNVPCPAGTMCDDDADRCIDDCATMGDLDNDGEMSVICGGADCDDSNPAVRPGNPEICDAVVDEDCDPTTFGDRDMDNDGSVDAACCNGTNCGDDCNDNNPAIRPGEVEACDMLDNDCDEQVDEMVSSTCYTDSDNDGFAPSGAMPMDICGDCGTGLTGTAPTTGGTTDCDDGDRDVFPGARELCNRIDDDCSSGGGVDAAEDMDNDGHTATSYTACETTPTTFPRDDCDDTNADRFGGQTQYFTTPLCSTMECSCPSGGRGCTNTVGFCVCDDPVSFDYDCDGVSSLEPEGCQAMCGGAVTNCGTVGPAYPAGGPPQCGQNVGVYNSCGPGCFTAAGCNRTTTGRGRRIGCR